MSQRPQVVVAPTSLAFTAIAGGTAPAAQTIAIADASGGALSWQATRTTQTGGSWLNITPSSGTDKTSLSASVSLTGLAAGTYQGAISLTVVGVNGTAATIPVTLMVRAPQVVVAPTSLTFTAIYGGANPATQTVAITEGTGGTLNWQATRTTQTGGSWLNITPSSGTDKTSLSVSISLTASYPSLAVGTYQGAISLTVGGITGTAATIPVTLTVRAPQVVVAPTSLTFTAMAGGANPAAQTVAITEASGAALSWQAARTTQTGGSWLNITPSSGTDKTLLSVSVSPPFGVSSLAAGTYQGAISLTVGGITGTAATIPVTLTVQSPQVVVAPTSLTFTAIAGGANPTAQTLAITEATGAALSWQATRTTQTGGSWLNVTPSSGTDKTLLSVSVSLTASYPSLAAGTYQGTITLTVNGITGTAATIPVTLTVRAPQVVITPTSLTFTGTAGGANPVAQTVAITEGTGAALSWQATRALGTWMNITPSSGTDKTPLSVSVSLTGIAAGTYQGTITLTVGGVTGTAATIPVTLTVR